VTRRVALATCAALPDLDEDDRPLVTALAELDVSAAAAVWDDASVEWGRFDLVVLRSTWDYAERSDAFLTWAVALPHVLNAPDVLAWGTDKERYLAELRDGGVSVVPTEFVRPGSTFEVPGEPFVVKPAISAGGRMSARFSPAEADAAAALAQRIHAEGRTVMVQPYLDADETSLVHIDGAFSHALRRRAPLPAGRERDVLYLEEELAPWTATEDERRVAEVALACLPEPLLYARVDLIGTLVLEVEVVEPSLYLAYGPGSCERFAAAIARRVAESHRRRMSPENGLTTSQ
jgi:glutathione synthase/RimK-type ligase-like ATP-grasp enzyme